MNNIGNAVNISLPALLIDRVIIPYAISTFKLFKSYPLADIFVMGENTPCPFTLDFVAARLFSIKDEFAKFLFLVVERVVVSNTQIIFKKFCP